MLSSEKAAELLLDERKQRIGNGIDVSPALDNCFFHAYALHLLGNNEAFPKDLFDTNEFDAPEIKELKCHLKNEIPRAELTAASEKYLFEKTLILGVLLRSWFFAQLFRNERSRDARFHFTGKPQSDHDLRIITFLRIVKDYKEALYQDAKAPSNRARINLEGALNYCNTLSEMLETIEEAKEANETLSKTIILILKSIQILKEYTNQPPENSLEESQNILGEVSTLLQTVGSKLKILKVEESLVALVSDVQKLLNCNLLTEVYFEKSFREQSEEENIIYSSNQDFFCQDLIDKDEEFIKEYWIKIGYQKYCSKLSQAGTKMNYADFDSGMEIPYAIYSRLDGSNVVCDRENPIFELAIDAGAAHYWLLATHKSSELLQHYKSQHESYTKNRDKWLSGQKGLYEDSFLLEAIIPAYNLGANPLQALVQKVPAFLERLLSKKEEQHALEGTTVNAQETGNTLPVASDVAAQELRSSTMRKTDSTEAVASIRENSNNGQYDPLLFPDPLEPQIQEAADVSSSSMKDDIDPTLLDNEELRAFYSQLKQLETKAKELNDKRKQSLDYSLAADAARDLHSSLHRAFTTFIVSDDRKEAYESFSKDSLEAIKKHRSPLEKHRKEGGLFMQILGNVVLGILGLGIFYGAALVVNEAFTGRYAFFAPKTAQEVSKIEKMLPEIKVK
ncbi:hypothetical protein [Legionella hackeliae]|uniref:Dot/Icm secretion system substrate n=1 Tax=Legionella hackeliae TaxID=449 RepID=A0A0A8USA7_LEGHA|nr:hypothetical protein [Legionella hackeliae]KTD14211.1 Dot/Icm secretion system substrate [Legionella hackeliae]CEK10421.1 protein of unknown function [Legionella hackeliae]STX47156.1 Dot/Icm secretion system substrate [Legionella hackeliae]